MRQHIIGAAVGAAALAGAGIAQADEIKIGFIATLSGPAAALGQDLLDGFQLGIADSGGTLGGLDVDLIVEDDQLKPDVGRQVAQSMLERDEVDMIVGIVFSNVMMAVAPLVIENETILVSANAGPSPLAGEMCSPYFFNVAWQNDNTHEAMGQYVKDQGFDNVYIMAPNYPAGTDALAGFKRFYDGGLAGEVYTQLNQTDYAAELAELRAANPDAVYIFYPGGMGVNFVKQYAQAGLMETIPLFGPSFSFDQTILPAVGEAALGVFNTSFWTQDLDNAANAQFVAGFEAAYDRIPSPYAAQAYDAARLLDSALAAVGGATDDTAALIAALEAADFESVRGPFRFNTNHFPIQNFYVREVVMLDDGRIGNALRGTVFEAHGDAYAADCPME
ncbi:MAG: ABC transporter substrate-binding protein [Alphaproteobacteria bacterium]